MALFNISSAILMGLQRQAAISCVSVLSLVTGIGATIILLINGYGLLAIPVGVCLDSFMRAAIGMTVAALTFSRRFRDLRFKFNFPLLSSLLRDSLVLFAGGGLFIIVARLPNVFIAHVYDPRLCNVYTFTLMAQTMLTTLVVLLSQAMLPGLAHMMGELGARPAKTLILRLTKVTLMACALSMGGMLALNEEFVRLWVGEAYFGGSLLNAVFCLTGVCAALFFTFQNVLVAAGGFGEAAKSNVFKSALHFFPLLAMGSIWGLVGVATSALLAFAAAVVFIQAPSLSRIFDFRNDNELGLIVHMIVVAAPPLIIGLVFKGLFAPHGLLQLLLWGALYTVATIGFYYAVDAEPRRLIREVLPSGWAPSFRE
jgi:O-antigen/teichoic acid export membrane protein